MIKNTQVPTSNLEIHGKEKNHRTFIRNKNKAI